MATVRVPTTHRNGATYRLEAHLLGRQRHSSVTDLCRIRTGSCPKWRLGRRRACGSDCNDSAGRILTRYCKSRTALTKHPSQTQIYLATSAMCATKYWLPECSQLPGSSAKLETLPPRSGAGSGGWMCALALPRSNTGRPTGNRHKSAEPVVTSPAKMRTC